MASSYSELKFELPATGEQSGTWGNTTNTNIGTAINEAIAGMAEVTIDGDTTLAWLNTAASQEARNYVLKLVAGTVAAGFNLVVPTIEKPYIVVNESGYTATVKTSAGTGVSVPTGKSVAVYVDGTDVIALFDYMPALSLGTALPISSGGTGSSTVSAGLVTSTGSAFGSTAKPTGTVVGTSDAQTLTNKIIQPRIHSDGTFPSSFTPDASAYDMFVATSQATSPVTFNVPSGTPYNGQKIIFRMTASTTVGLGFNAAGYRAVGVVLPSTLSSGYTLYVGCIWNSTASIWDVVAVNSGS